MSNSRKFRRGSRSFQRMKRQSDLVVFTDCPGCSLCELLAGTGGTFVTIHPWEDSAEQSVPTKRNGPTGKSDRFSINTPADTGADQRVQRNG